MQENSKIRIEQVNTLCYYYAHFTAERAQLKKKKIYNRKHKSFGQKLCFLSSTFSWQPNREIKENSGSLISYYSQVIDEKAHYKNNLKKKVSIFSLLFQHFISNQTENQRKL